MNWQYLQELLGENVYFNVAIKAKQQLEVGKPSLYLLTYIKLRGLGSILILISKEK